MEDRRSGRLNVWTPLLFALILILGMTLGFNMRDTLRKKRDIQTIIERNDRLEEIIDLIQEKYVDSVNANALYQDAITGILSHLDPHTVYISAEELQSVNENLEGSFYGIGVEFMILKDTIQVTSVMENGPAAHAGMEPGDKLIKVNDSLVAGVKITSDMIMQKIRGKQYSRVMLTIKDAQNGQLRNVTIQRNAIPIYSVDAAFMIDKETGFIKINRFSATTYDEFRSALEKLINQGMTSLILDLRQNPGGYLEAATSVADQFLSGNKLIVYTQGTRSPRTEYRADNTGIFETGRLAVLIDEGSASASEILSGAIQDWDRGILVGRRTFGKGLVQEPYDLEDGASLRLTVSRYYTPSGRSIQRSYKQGKEAYSEDLEKRYESGELTGSGPKAPQDTSKYYTHNERVVFGGGGITPDIYVPYDSMRLSPKLMNIVFSTRLKNVLWEYYIAHKEELSRYKTVEAYDAHCTAEQELVHLFLESLNPEERKSVEKVIGKPSDKAYLMFQIKAQLARILFRNNGYYRITLKEDNVVQKALQELKSDNYLKIIGR